MHQCFSFFVLAVAIPLAGNRHFYCQKKPVDNFNSNVAIPLAGNRHFYLDLPRVAYESGVAIPFAGNRHFYPTLAGCPARAAFRGRNLPRLYFFVFSLESNRLFCENLKHFFEVINNTSVYSSDYFTTSEQNCNRMLSSTFPSTNPSISLPTSLMTEL